MAPGEETGGKEGEPKDHYPIANGLRNYLPREHRGLGLKKSK